MEKKYGDVFPFGQTSDPDRPASDWPGRLPRQPAAQRQGRPRPRGHLRHDVREAHEDPGRAGGREVGGWGRRHQQGPGLSDAQQLQAVATAQQHPEVGRAMDTMRLTHSILTAKQFFLGFFKYFSSLFFNV